ncbi:MAG: hypothetical protein HY563_05685 [Ignavibacteriales bacterium]|nr:hypothetical protein [Ignavibacteriales bacterium]
METKRPTGVLIIIPALLAAHVFGAIALLTRWREIQTNHPRLTDDVFPLAAFLIFFSMTGLIATWYWKRWGPVCVTAAYVLVLLFDAYFGIYHHMYVATGAIMLYWTVVWPIRKQLR